MCEVILLSLPVLNPFITPRLTLPSFILNWILLTCTLDGTLLAITWHWYHLYVKAVRGVLLPDTVERWVMFVCSFLWHIARIAWQFLTCFGSCFKLLFLKNVGSGLGIIFEINAYKWKDVIEFLKYVSTILLPTVSTNIKNAKVCLYGCFFL